MAILTFNTVTNSWEYPTDGKLTGSDITPTFSVDVTVTDNAKGLVLKSATKTWRITINDSGVLVITQI